MKKIDFVLPVYNEEKNILPIYNAIMDQCLENYEFSFIFVNDGSHDETLNELRKLSEIKTNITCLSFSRNFGHQAALSAGLNHSRNADAIICMDCDLQHPPELIPKMLKKWSYENFDVVYTIRNYHKETKLLKRLTSSLYYKLINKLTHIHIPKGAADFRLWDKKVLLQFQRIKEKSTFLRGLSPWLGFKQTGLKYEASKRLHGKSNYNYKKMIILALDGITSFSSFPLYISSIIGFLFVLFGVIWGGNVIYVKLFTDQSAQGWASLMILIILIGGIQISLLGIIGVYLAKIHEQIQRRPEYIIEEII